jgi:hypothetical protein
MRQHQQRRLDAFRRAQDFMDANASRLGALATSEGRRQLDAAVTALGDLGTEQGSADRRMAGQSSRERALTNELRNQHMQPIATFARARLRGVPDIAALTRSAPRLKGAHLVRSARAMATAAAPHTTALVSAGFPADTLAQLGTSADALQSALLDRANTKVGRVGATKGIEQQVIAGREALAMLHAVISRQFANDPTFLAAWNAARRVNHKPGAVRSGSAVPAVPAA